MSELECEAISTCTLPAGAPVQVLDATGVHTIRPCRGHAGPDRTPIGAHRMTDDRTERLVVDDETVRIDTAPHGREFETIHNRRAAGEMPGGWEPGGVATRTRRDRRARVELRQVVTDLFVMRRPFVAGVTFGLGAGLGIALALAIVLAIAWNL